MNVVTIAIDLAAITYYIIIIIKLYNVYHSIAASAMNEIKDLINQVAYFFGITMAVSAVAIWASFFMMRNVLVKSVSLQDS